MPTRRAPPSGTLPDVLARFAPLEAEPVGSSSADFGRFVVSELARWTDVAKSGNIKLER